MIFWSKRSLNDCPVFYFSEIKWFLEHLEATTKKTLIVKLRPCKLPEYVCSVTVYIMNYVYVHRWEINAGNRCSRAATRYSFTAVLKLVKHTKYIKTASSFNPTVVNEYRNVCFHMISFTQRNDQSPTRCVLLFSTTHCSLKAYCAILVRRSNFRHQASPRVSPR
jgi:hypothetical protein